MQSFFLIFYFILEYSFLLKYNYLQCCVSGVLQKWLSYSLIYSFSDSFPIEVITDHWVWFSVLYSSSLFFFFFCFVFWTVLVFLAVCGLSRVASGVCSLIVHRLLTSGAFSGCGAWALGAHTSEAGSAVAVHVACGIFPDQGSNPCPLHCKVDS